MNNIIEFFYDFSNIKVYEYKNYYYFKYNDSNYVLYKCDIKIQDVESIYKLLENSNNHIVLNIYKQIITMIDGINYVLIKVLDTKYNIFNKNIINDLENYVDINKSDWGMLWIKKIDYIKYQIEHIKGKYLVLESYLDYFCGMGETAISYYNNILMHFDKRLLKYSLSHRRVMFNLDFYNINNIIVDYYVRDISEYFKYLFFNTEVDYNYIERVINSLKISREEYELLFCRLLFPTYFFDLYDLIVNGSIEEEKIKEVVNKIDLYENFLKKIFIFINKKTKITSIDWLS